MTTTNHWVRQTKKAVQYLPCPRPWCAASPGQRCKAKTGQPLSSYVHWPRAYPFEEEFKLGIKEAERRAERKRARAA